MDANMQDIIFPYPSETAMTFVAINDCLGFARCWRKEANLRMGEFIVWPQMKQADYVFRTLRHKFAGVATLAPKTPSGNWNVGFTFAPDSDHKDFARKARAAGLWAPTEIVFPAPSPELVASIKNRTDGISTDFINRWRNQTPTTLLGYRVVPRIELCTRVYRAIADGYPVKDVVVPKEQWKYLVIGERGSDMPYYFGWVQDMVGIGLYP